MEHLHEIDERLRSHDDTLRAFGERLSAQEKALKGLDIEWDEWFDKFRLMYARLSKRIKEAAPEGENGHQPLQDAPRSTIEVPGGPVPSRRNY